MPCLLIYWQILPMASAALYGDLNVHLGKDFGSFLSSGAKRMTSPPECMKAGIFSFSINPLMAMAVPVSVGPIMATTSSASNTFFRAITALVGLLSVSSITSSSMRPLMPPCWFTSSMASITASLCEVPICAARPVKANIPAILIGPAAL